VHSFVCSKLNESITHGATIKITRKIFGCCQYVANKGVNGRQVFLVRVLTTRLGLAGRVATIKKHGVCDFVDERV